MKKVFAAICAAAAMTACGTGNKTVSGGDLNGEWSIVSIKGQSVAASEGQDSPFIGFDTGGQLVYGSTGCNRLTGTLNADTAKGTIDFGSLGSTRMMCPDMQTERQVLDALGSVKTYRLQKDGSMQLNDTDGKTVMELKKK